MGWKDKTRHSGNARGLYVFSLGQSVQALASATAQRASYTRRDEAAKAGGGSVEPENALLLLESHTLRFER